MNRKHAVPHKKPANVGKIIKRLLSYLNNYKIHMFVVCILIITFFITLSGSDPPFNLAKISKKSLKTE